MRRIKHFIMHLVTSIMMCSMLLHVAIAENNNDYYRIIEGTALYTQWNNRWHGADKNEDTIPDGIYNSTGSINQQHTLATGGCGVFALAHIAQWLNMEPIDVLGELPLQFAQKYQYTYSGGSWLTPFCRDYALNADWSTSLAQVLLAGGADLMSLNGHYVAAVEISADKQKVHIIDSCSYVAQNAGIVCYSYDKKTNTFTRITDWSKSAGSVDAIYNSDLTGIFYNNYAGKPYGGAEYWIDLSVANSMGHNFLYKTQNTPFVPPQETSNSLTFSIFPTVSGSIIAKKPDLVDLNVYGDNTVTSGTIISLTANPKEGYDFIGWSATNGRFADSTSATTTFTMPAYDTVITANFAEKTAPKYQLTLSAGTGGTVNTNAAGSYAAGAKINLSAAASAGYAFVDWTINGGSIEDKDAASTVFTMPEVAATVTANFEPVYALTINAETGGSITQGTSGSYPEGKTISLAAQPNNGYEFWKWTTSNGGSFNYPNSSYTTFTMPAQATTVTAHFKQPTITEWTSTSAEALLGPDAKMKGRVEFASDRKVVEVGCYLGTDPNEVLLVNSGGLDGSTPVYKVSNKVDAGIASQQGDGYRFLDVSFTATGRNTQSNASTPDAAGFGLTALEPETKYYYMFYVVLDDGSTVQSAMSTDEVGEFKSYGNVQHSLAVKATEGGSVNGSFDGSYVAGQKIILSAQAASGYVFSHWSSDYSDWNGSYFENITSATGCVFSMPNADVTVTACFVPSAPAAKYNLMLQADEGGVITSGASGQYDETATVSIAAQANPGYSFVKWETTAGTFTDMYSPATVFAMTSSDAVVTAKFGSNAANIAVSPLTHDFGKVNQLSLGAFVQYQMITVTNNGSQAVTLVPKSGQSFMFENEKAIHLEAGKNATLFVYPYDTLTPGTYSETLNIETHEGLTAGSVELSIEVTAGTPGSYASLSVSPFKVGEFGEWYVGSAQPAARTVTVRYVGTEDIVLEQPTLENYADYFTVGTLSKSTLSPNETATFTIQPKANIPLGYYSTMVQIKGITQYGGQNVDLSTSQGVSIHVQKAAIAASPTSISFGTLQVGYTVPAEQVISLTNTGNTWINVEIPQPVLSSFDITATRTPERWPSDGLQISLGSSFLISVKPKEGLPEGIYNETLCVPLETPNGMLVVNVPLNVTIGAGSSIPVAPTIMTDSLPNGTVGVAYSQTLVSTGDTPIIWSAEGTLPAGLTLSNGGVISGTPTAVGTSTFTVKARNGVAPDAYVQFTITIDAVPVAASPTSINFGTVPVGCSDAVAQSIALTNSGNVWIYMEIAQPMLNYFDISVMGYDEWPSWGVQISEGSPLRIFVQPKARLPEGSYVETLQLPLSITNGILVVSVPLSMTVGPAFEQVDFVLPAQLTQIGLGAFRGAGMTSVRCPYGVMRIEEYAFADCANLKQIDIPASVMFIDDTAFEGCSYVYFYGEAGSEAEAFASRHANIGFIAR